jgi:hypothetical protein
MLSLGALMTDEIGQSKGSGAVVIGKPCRCVSTASVNGGSAQTCRHKHKLSSTASSTTRQQHTNSQADLRDQD